MSRRERWRRLPADERADTIFAALLMPVCAVAIRVTRLTSLLDLIARRGAARMDASPHRRIAVCVRSVERASVHSPWTGSCLTRSLSLMYLLARRGVATELKLGGRLHSGAFAAHAWVEYDGVALNDQAGQRHEYALLPQRRTAAWRRPFDRTRPT
jgi:hypothetical protein